MKQLDEAIERLEERAKADVSKRRSVDIEVASKVDVDVFLKLGLAEMRGLLSRKPVEIVVPDSKREGHRTTVTLVYIGNLAG